MYENLALEINIWKVKHVSICPFVISAEEVVTKKS